MTDIKFQVRLPADARGLKIDDEYFHVRYDGKEQKIRLHEYEKIYRIPGLYEYIVSRTLKRVSPEIVSGLLVEQVLMSGGDLLRVKDSQIK